MGRRRGSLAVRPLLLLLTFAATAAPAAGAGLRRHLRQSEQLHGEPAQVAPGPKPKASSDEVRPQVFFLFMAYGKIYHQDIWENFLSGARRGVDYTALVHCKDEAACRKSVVSSRFMVIPSVPTSYCMDLVSGMNALLKAAIVLSGMGSARDKFAFVSDTTLPVKPFFFVYRQLTGDSASDFCVFPRNEWAEVTQASTNGTLSTVRIAPKHHQWIVLARRHAELAVERSGRDMDLMKQLQLNGGGHNLNYRNTGCLDEFWHFSTIFDTLRMIPGGSSVKLQDFNGGPLDSSNYEVQGRCNTFVQWVPRATGKANNITVVTQALTVDVGTDMVPASNVRPSSFKRFGRSSLTALRDSPFLFVRKVTDSAKYWGCQSLPEAFSALVFASPPTALAGDDETWHGAGMWLDNQHSPVKIDGLRGSLSIAGNHKDMRAKGFYCGKHMEVTFETGYMIEAEVSDDGQQLRWTNGVVWHRPRA